MQSPSLTRNPRPHRIFLTYSLLAQFKTGVTKRTNLRHLVTCRTNILWLIYTARRTNSNGLNFLEKKNLFKPQFSRKLRPSLFSKILSDVAVTIYSGKQFHKDQDLMC